VARRRNKVFLWEYKKYFATNNLPAVFVETDNHKKKCFYEELEYLIRLLWNDGIRLINYAHITFIVPKTELPLKYKSEHYCLSYINNRGYLILIKLKVIPPEKQPKYAREAIWGKRE